MSATCGSCKQEMAPGAGCTVKFYPGSDFPDKKRRERTPFGSEQRAVFGWDPAVRLGPVYEHEPGTHCHDCNVALGQLHHPGCDSELCPACHWQAIACWCDK